MTEGVHLYIHVEYIESILQVEAALYLFFFQKSTYREWYMILDYTAY
jgi:hypothetical protein